MPKLGFGLMRLPTTNDVIDIEAVKRMVDAYMEKGFNYFDTAYVYHGGESEVAANKALVSRYPRDSFFLATKLPAWEVHSLADRDRVFNEQLERTGAGYFDFYLLHSLEDGNNYDSYVKYDCFNWAKEKVAEGKIRHFGFSFHGTPALLNKVLDEHPEVEFVQIQLNYTDWNNPLVHSGELYDILHKRGVPTIVMEPVKGGSLANLSDDLQSMMKAYRPNNSIASWAFRFVASLEGVTTILSGMSNEEQMNDNLNTFTNFEPLDNKEREIIDTVVKTLQEKPLIQCTACRYCCDGCPSNINIPEIFKALNTKRLYPNDARPNFFYGGLADRGGRAKDCIACAQCEGVCPQHLPIIELLKEASERFD
jgi:hypothetical protein